MYKRNLFVVIYFALVLSSICGKIISSKDDIESELIADLLLEKDLYLALPTFGTQNSSIYRHLNPNFYKSQCDNLNSIFKSQYKTIYIMLKEGETNQMTIVKCENIYSFELLLVSPEYVKYLSKVQLVQSLKIFFLSEQNREIILATKIVRNKALLRESFSPEEKFKETQESQIKEFQLYADIYGVLSAVNYFYIVNDFELFWYMSAEIKKIESERILNKQETYLFVAASENLCDIYLARLWAYADSPLNLNCNYGCSGCSDDFITCKQCKTGYFLDKSACIKCSKLCESCTEEQICLTCVKNAIYQPNLFSCKCGAMFGINSITSDCQPCEDRNCIDCGESQKSCKKCKEDYFLSQGSCRKIFNSNSRNLKYQNIIEDYSKNCSIYGTNTTMLNYLKSQKVTGDLLELIIKDFQNYVNNEEPNNKLLDNTISIVYEFLNNLQTEAFEEYYTLVYANALKKVMAGLKKISFNRSKKVMKIAEKILKNNSLESKTDATVIIINSLLELYKEVGYVTRFKTKHIIVFKAENLEKNLKPFSSDNITLLYYKGNFNKTQLVTLQIIIISKPLREIHINLFSDKSYINSEIYFENKTDLVLSIPATIKFEENYNSTKNCIGRNTSDQEISCKLLEGKNYYYINFNQSGIYSFSHLKKKPETMVSSFAISLLLFWMVSNIFFLLFRKITIKNIFKSGFAKFKDTQVENIGGNAVNTESNQASTLRNEPIIEYHLCLGFVVNSYFFPKIERISIYLPTLILELFFQIYLNEEFSLRPLAQSIISVIMTLPFTITITYFLLFKYEKLITKGFLLLFLVFLTRIIYSLNSSIIWINSFALGAIFDLVVNQTILLLFIKKLRS